jgi:broad specificity phosphatase PhoE
MSRLRLYLLRHGETDTGGRYPFNGWTDVGLTDLGKRQLEQAARALAPVPFDRVITSDLFRARYGAEIIASNAKRELEIESEWREMHFGYCEGMAYEDLKSAFPELGEAVLDPGGKELDFPGGESNLGFVKRVGNILRKLLAETPEGRVIVVSHSGTGRAVLANLFNFTMATMWSFHQSHAGLHVLDIYDGKTAVARVLDAYLGPEGYASPGPGLTSLIGESGGREG